MAEPALPEVRATRAFRGVGVIDVGGSWRDPVVLAFAILGVVSLVVNTVEWVKKNGF